MLHLFRPVKYVLTAKSKACGSSGAARAVGSVMAKNFDPKVPCHRVIRADGTVGAYNRGGPVAKRRLLEGEGVTLQGDKVKLKARG